MAKRRRSRDDAGSQTRSDRKWILFVHNVAKDTTLEALLQLFVEYGDADESASRWIRSPRDELTGCAKVVFKRAEGEKVRALLSGKEKIQRQPGEAPLGVKLFEVDIAKRKRPVSFRTSY